MAVTSTEFLRRIRVDSPTGAQTVQAQQALDAAQQEADYFLSRLVATPPTLTTRQTALYETVIYERAAEHWRMLPYGALNTGPDLPPVLTARDGFYRHARKLASLKTSWGVA